MNREQAELERDRLAAEQPDVTWLLHGDDATGWSVARVGIAPAVKPEGTVVEAAEKPPPADTRTSVQQNTGGHYGF